MRIALCVGSLAVGGTEKQLARLAAELTSEGHEVKVFVLVEGGPLAADLDADGISWEAFGCLGRELRSPTGWLKPRVVVHTVWRILRYWLSLRSFRPDVCHAFLCWPYLLSMPGAALARIPVRIIGRRGHAPEPKRGRLVHVGLRRLAAWCSHAVVANSNVPLAELRRDHLPDAKMRVIPNGVDIPERLADPSRQPPVGAMVANLIRYKGHADLLAALALLESPPLIRLVGIGPERHELEGEIARLGLDDVVRLEGHHPRAAEIFREVQFALLTSHDEGLPNAVLEAMAAGLPVVATAVGGVPELIEHGRTGLLVPPSDPAALAGAIAVISSDPARRAEYGRAARAKALEFSWERCRDSHLTLYRELLCA